MPERHIFPPLHPTARKYAYGEIDREPLPKQLLELVERLRDAEAIRDPQVDDVGRRTKQT